MKKMMENLNHLTRNERDILKQLLGAQQRSNPPSNPSSAGGAGSKSNKRMHSTIDKSSYCVGSGRMNIDSSRMQQERPYLKYVNEFSEDSSGRCITTMKARHSIESPVPALQTPLDEEQLLNLKNPEVYGALPLNHKLEVTKQCNMFHIIVEQRKLDQPLELMSPL